MNEDLDVTEEYVLVELSGFIEQDWFSRIGNKCKIVGLASEQPVLQLGRHVFTGEYEDAIGTRVLFEKHSDAVNPARGATNATTSAGETEASSSVSLRYACHTHKVLKMQRVFLSEKKDSSTEKTADDMTSDRMDVDDNVKDMTSSEHVSGIDTVMSDLPIVDNKDVSRT